MAPEHTHACTQAQGHTQGAQTYRCKHKTNTAPHSSGAQPWEHPYTQHLHTHGYIHRHNTRIYTQNRTICTKGGGTLESIEPARIPTIPPAGATGVYKDTQNTGTLGHMCAWDHLV